MAFSFNFSNPFTASEAAPAAMPQEMPVEQAADAFFSAKRDLLAQVSEAAKQSGHQPRLDDYRIAAEKWAATDQGKALLDGHDWAPIMADLSGQTLNGFILSEPKKALEAVVAEKAESEAVGMPQNHAAHKMSDAYDQDGDGQINSAAVHPFYEHVNLDGASLKDCYIWPATTFNDQIAKAKEIENVTFDGMKHGDEFKFGNGQYNNITLTNINGGDITFEGAKVDGLNMEGAKVASITLDDKTVISHLNARNANIVRIDAEPGAILQHADFAGATIDMASHLEGAKFTDVRFSKSNLNDVDFAGATLTNVRFNDTDLKHMNLEGATLSNVSIDGKAITSAEQLKAHGITGENITISATKDFVLQSQISSVRENSAGWNVHNDVAPEAVANAGKALGVNIDSIREAMDKAWAAPAAEKSAATAPERSGPDMAYFARMSQNSGRPG